MFVPEIKIWTLELSSKKKKLRLLSMSTLVEVLLRFYWLGYFSMASMQKLTCVGACIKLKCE